jgi:hypothetical protein
MFNLTMQGYTRRSQWKKLPANHMVISKMNELAGTLAITEADIAIHWADEKMNGMLHNWQLMCMSQQRTRCLYPLEAMAVDSEVNENDDDPNMPELIENV